MMLPTEAIALAEARREAMEREVRLQQSLAQIPRRPARWRLITGGGLMWAGTRLVRWGNHFVMTYRSQTAQGIG